MIVHTRQVRRLAVCGVSDACLRLFGRAPLFLPSVFPRWLSAVPAVEGSAFIATFRQKQPQTLLISHKE